MSRVKDKDRKRQKHFRIVSPIKDKSLLFEEYVINGLKRKEIAKKYSVKESFIKDLLQEYNIKSPNSGRFKKKKLSTSDDTIRRMYAQQKKTIQQIAEEIVSTYWCVQEALKRTKTTRRGSGDRLVNGHPMKGKKPSFETRKKQSIAKTGIKEEDWRGFSVGRNRAGAKRFRREVLERDHYSCKFCCSNENLEAHHILPVRSHPDQISDPSNGITLCSSCHLSIRDRELEVYTFCLSRLRDYEIYKWQSYCGTGQLYANPQYVEHF